MRIVVHWTTGNEEIAIGNANAILHDERVDVEDIAIVAMGDAIRHVTQGSQMTETMDHMMRQGAEFRACRNSMENNDIHESNLIDYVDPVDSGPGELVRLQDKGRFYIRP